MIEIPRSTSCLIFICLNMLSTILQSMDKYILSTVRTGKIFLECKDPIITGLQKQD